VNRLLLLEDESVIRKQLKILLERNNYNVFEAATVDEALAIYPESFDVILADIRLPGRDGNQIHQYCKQVPVIMMTSYASVRSAVESMKLGAVDYISKPFDHDELLMTITRSLAENRISSQNAAMRRDLKRLYPQSEVVSLDLTMQQSISGLKNISTSDLFVYIQGERGTDKELLARLCPKHSDRNCGPLVFADFPMYKTGELSGLLFGSKNTAQGTGGGLLQAAHGGTLVVRNINELSLEAQLTLANYLMEVKTLKRAPNIRLIMLSD